MAKDNIQNCNQQDQGLSDLMTEKQLAEYLKVSIYGSTAAVVRRASYAEVR